MTGKFLTFEGGDGCGKTTQVASTVQFIKGLGYNVVHTNEPGDTPLGKEIRHILLTGDNTPVPAAELLLFLADRAQHVEEVIKPALKRGDWVVCDRYSDSTLAYQLAGRKLDDTSSLRSMLKWAEQGVVPDMTLWLDLPVDEAGKRMIKREEEGGKTNRLDNESRAFHVRVYDAYKDIYSENADLKHYDEKRLIQRVDSSGSIDVVQGLIRESIIQLDNQRNMEIG